MPSNDNYDLCHLSIAEIGQAYAERRLSPVEVTKAYLHRIRTRDGRLHCYTTVLAKSAMAAAERSEERFANGASLGPLDGIPIALKDVIDTGGVLTTANSPLYEDRIPDADATVVQKLKRAGSILLGKHAMYELHLGVPEIDGPFPAARNPWNTKRIPGGSSSGSAAAVAAGLSAGALGTDTGGSIRGPAAYCGIVGFKPTAGLVSRHGVIPLSWTLDQVGPMTRTVEDAAILLQALAGHDPLDIGSARTEIPDYRRELPNGIAGRRIGAPLAFLDREMDLHPDTREAFDDALATLDALGADVREIDLPEGVGYASDLLLVIATAEAFAFHEENSQTQPERFGRNFAGIPLLGALFTAADYIQAQRGRTEICQAMARTMETLDLVALPTTSSPALEFAAEAQRSVSRPTTLLRRLFSLTGQPAISIPCGFSKNTLPIGFQLAGQHHQDETVLAAACAYEQATEWHLKHPSL
jgi:aspartyl-tRNA(Asn)/glutamyl-tRNA(Gln) amidotransferase subunit A